MKIVVSCDAILGRDYYLEIIESVLDQVGDNCEIYTLAHNQGSVIGPVEQRKVHSSFLSHKVKSWFDLLKNDYLIPSASENLFIPCSVDLIINISRGFSSGLKKCNDTKMITYLVEDLNSGFEKKSFFKKLATKFVRQFQVKALNQADTLWVGVVGDLKNKITRDYIEVLPPVKLLDYKPLPDNMFARDYFLINASELTIATAQEFILKFRDQKFKFIGNDDHLESLKKDNEALFFGDRCGGELAPLLNGAKFLIDFEVSNLPINTLKMLSCSRPVLGLSNQFISFGHGYQAYNDNLEILEFDKEKTRAIALGFEELKFKHLLKREIDKYTLSSVQKANFSPSGDCC